MQPIVSQEYSVDYKMLKKTIISDSLNWISEYAMGEIAKVSTA